MKIDEYRDKALSLLNTLNEKNPYLVILGLLCVVLVADYFLIMQFQIGTLGSLDEKMAGVRKNVDESEENIQRFAAFQNELKRLRAKYEKIDRRVHGKDELPLIMENISRIANNNNLRVGKMMPNTADLESIMKNNDGQYFSIPIQVEAKSDYHNFGRFLNQLENEQIFMRVPEFVIRAGRDDQTRHDIELTLHAIVFEKEEE